MRHQLWRRAFPLARGCSAAKQDTQKRDVRSANVHFSAVHRCAMRSPPISLTNPPEHTINGERKHCGTFEYCHCLDRNIESNSTLFEAITERVENPHQGYSKRFCGVVVPPVTSLRCKAHILHILVKCSRMHRDKYQGAVWCSSHITTNASREKVRSQTPSPQEHAALNYVIRTNVTR